MPQLLKQFKIGSLVILIFFIGFASSNLIRQTTPPLTAANLKFDEQEASIRAIKKVSPAVVSIIVYVQTERITINLDTMQRNTTKEKVKKGSGTGFLISSDGLIITNKHVISLDTEKNSEYRIILNSGKEYYAQLIGKDLINDLAVLKIFDKNLPVVEMGDSDKLGQGMTVMAIGNALGIYQNSVTKGIVSGLGRSIVAGDQSGNSETLDNVIQTDAGINPGNSGGPLIDLDGKVMGINTAIDQSGESIGFAIPINDAKVVINSVKKNGRIIRPRLGISYIMLTPELVKDNKLARSNGAWITKGDSSSAVISGSPAEKAGLQEGDIIFEINAKKLEGKTTLLSVIQRFKPGDKIVLRVQRGKAVFSKHVVLDELK